MPVTISDETLKAAGMTEPEMKLEIACRLFDAGKLNLWPAAQLAGMSRDEFWEQLIARGIPVIRVDEAYLKHEMEYASQFPMRDKPLAQKEDAAATPEQP